MIKIFKKLFRRLRAQNSESIIEGSANPLVKNLEQNIRQILLLTGESSDVVYRKFNFGSAKKHAAAIFYIDGLVDEIQINQNVLKPIMKSEIRNSQIADVAASFLPVGYVRQVGSYNEFINGFLNGNTGLLIDGESEALIIETKGWEKRAVNEPLSEVVVKGPHDGFIETLRVNTALLRRRITNPNLRFEKMVIGSKTNTNIALAYIRGVVSEDLLSELRQRLQRIDIEGLLSDGYIEEYIEDAPLSLFSTVGYTERPDVCAAKIVEGRVAIFVDGTPIVNTVPCLFIESFQSPDDYNFRPFFGTAIRWLRYIAYAITTTLPGMYVAIISFHQELVPTPLLLSIAAANEGTPFPVLAETLLLGAVFEIMREAGIRLPRSIGQTISIVGALVIGETTVMAGLVSVPMLIIISLSAIASFLVPDQTESALFISLFLTVLGGFLGLYGVLVGLIIIYLHLAGLRSFGVPYLAPLAPLLPADFKDVLIRAPLWMLNERLRSIFRRDKLRQVVDRQPSKPDGGEK